MSIENICLFLRSEVIRWYRHHIYFSKAALFLLGLVFAHGFVKNAVVDVLMLYLTENWKHQSLMKSAAVVNIEEAISGVIAIIISILTEAWVGRFKMVLFTTPSFILGLLLLWLSTWLLPLEMKTPIFFVALLLISFGKAGKDPPFKSFLRDQLKGNDEEQVEDRTMFWWRVCKFIGAATAVYVYFMAVMSWKEIFLISAAVMGATYLIFLAGICYPYNYTSPPGNPFPLLLKVVKAAFAKRGLNYPCTPDGYFLNQRNEVPLFPPDPFLRWIDKAAIVEQPCSQLRVETELQEENLCTAAQVRQAKSLFRLIPLWFAFILYGVVTAAGSTFFIEQSSGLNEHIGNSFRFPVNSFFIIRSLISSIASYLANLAHSRWFSKNESVKLRGALVRVGAGIFVSIFCCEVAWQVEYNRLDLVLSDGNPDTEDVILPMTILWLTPQFILLGLMDGLSEDGLGELFYIFVDASLHEFETPVNQLMLGIGKALSVASVYVCRRWFGDTINTSRLDKYFSMLLYLSIGNLVFYILIGSYYVNIQKRETRSVSYRERQQAAQVQQPEPGPEPVPEQKQEQEHSEDVGDDVEIDLHAIL